MCAAVARRERGPNARLGRLSHLTLPAHSSNPLPSYAEWGKVWEWYGLGRYSL